MNELLEESKSTFVKGALKVAGADAFWARRVRHSSYVNSSAHSTEHVK